MHHDICPAKPRFQLLARLLWWECQRYKTSSIYQNVHCTDQCLFFMYCDNLLSACQLNRISNSGGKLRVRANKAPKHFHGNCPWDKKDEAENKMSNKRSWFHKAKCQLASEIKKACYILIIILLLAHKIWLGIISNTHLIYNSVEWFVIQG